MKAAIVQSQIDFYRQNGYLIYEGLFATKEADKLNRYIRRHANSDFAALVNPDRYEKLSEQDERPKSDIVLEEIKETADYCRLIMKSPNIVSILDAINGKEIVGLSSQFIYKEAYSIYSSQAWNTHQDSWYPGDKNGEYVTANWFLKNADKENGTIYLYPGSHKLGLLDATPNKSFRENPNANPGSECRVPDSFVDKKVDIVLSENSVVFMHGYLIHGSYPNNSERSRPWYSCCYISKGEDFLVGKNANRIVIPLR